MLLERYDPKAYTLEQRILTGTAAGKPYGPAYPQTPRFLIVHSTATNALGLETDTVAREYAYFNDPANQASATFCVDSSTLAQLIPLEQQAWHCCGIGNRVAWGIEMAESKDKATALEVIKRTIWLCVKMVLEHGVQILAHSDVSAIWPSSEFGKEGTTHQDPHAFLESVGFSWQDFLRNVDALVAQARAQAVVLPPVQVTIGGQNVTGVLYGGVSHFPIRPTIAAASRELTGNPAALEVNWHGPTSPITVDKPTK